MTPFYDRDGIRIFVTDVLAGLRALPDCSVQCCVTSPPYWGLRAYGTDPQVWGGDENCQHEFGGDLMGSKRGHAGFGTSTLVGTQTADLSKSAVSSGAFCQKCNAWHGEFGNEPTIELYVEHSVLIFREVRRVLRDDGALWLNIGDSYQAGQGGRQSAIGELPKKVVVTTGAAQHRDEVDVAGWSDRDVTTKIIAPCGPKPKDLCGIPWRVALALQADGWYLRQDIIWSKPNPMPESVTDRCTKSHEYVFLMTKSARYFYDAISISEPVAAGTILRLGQATLEQQHGSSRVPGKTNGTMKAVPPRFGGQQYGDSDDDLHRTKSGNEYELTTGKRNRRSVWTVATQPFKEAHFATFPQELISPMIMAGTSERGCCSVCGSPQKRVIEKIPGAPASHNGSDFTNGKTGAAHESRGQGERYTTRPAGWQPSCKCEASTVPCTVLDPFSGAGTTGLVCRNLGRHYIGLELNPKYAEMSARRIERRGEQPKKEVVMIGQKTIQFDD